MQDWQKDIYTKLAQSDPREMKMYMGGRQIGKSAIAKMWQVVYANEQEKKMTCEVITKTLVDTKPFYTVQCSKAVSDWIREQPEQNKDWFEHIDQNWYVDRNKFDISEEFYMMLRLRWGI